MKKPIKKLNLLDHFNIRKIDDWHKKDIEVLVNKINELTIELNRLNEPTIPSK